MPTSEACLKISALLFLALLTAGWGFPVHRHINRSAAEALPEPLRGWIMAEVDWLASHATDADKRKHTVEREAPRHYIDLDAPALICLDTLGAAPWFSKAAAACSEDTLWAYGVLPWQLQWTYAKLVTAMDSMDREGILRHAADLGHYVADAHVPLHTTLNYNGQLSGQEGIHAVWETRLPSLFGGGYDLVVQRVGYVSDVPASAWKMVAESHEHVGHLLEKERVVTHTWKGSTWVREARGGTMQLQQQPDWCEAYHEELGGMVELQWRKAIGAVSAFWYSAWIDAGQPDLEGVLSGKQRRMKRSRRRTGTTH